MSPCLPPEPGHLPGAGVEALHSQTPGSGSPVSDVPEMTNMLKVKYAIMRVKYGIPDVTLDDSGVCDNGPFRFRVEEPYLRLLRIVHSFEEILFKLIEGS